MTYPDNFLKALNFTLKWEGGYSNNPNDSGGATNKGITQRVFDNYRKSKGKSMESVRYITTFEVMDIYYNNYWLASKCDTHPIRLGVSIFDFSVNSGIVRALKYLEQSNSDLYNYLQSREQFYRAIAKGHNSVFLKGWLNRLAALKCYLNTLNP